MVATAYHLFVDGSCCRAEAKTAWEFIVVVVHSMGDFVLDGFATDFIAEQQAADMGCESIDNICVEAVSILYASA